MESNNDNENDMGDAVGHSGDGASSSDDDNDATFSSSSSDDDNDDEENDDEDDEDDDDDEKMDDDTAVKMLITILCEKDKFPAQQRNGTIADLVFFVFVF